MIDMLAPAAIAGIGAWACVWACVLAVRASWWAWWRRWGWKR